jgi:hypothetical protein
MTKKIEFFSTIAGLADLFPIVYARNNLPNWVDACRQNYKVAAAKNGGNARFPHTYRCPGIFEILGEGFLVTMPWDVTIETNGDPWNFKWTLPDDELTSLMNVPGVPLINSHAEAASMLPVPPGAMPTIIKIVTPWHVVAPAGVKFLVLPLSYSETFEFEHVPGILDPGLSSEINFLLRWYVLNGVHKIKAGTPIAHIIPISEKSYELICRDATAWDKLWVEKRKFLINFSFTVQRKRLKDAFKAHFG